MEPFGIGITGLGVAGLASLGAFGLAFRQRRRRLEAAPRRARSVADRLEALAAAQADLGLRFEALAAQGAAPEERLQALAGQLLGLIRDKNATLETALAGLDQLRARMRALEQMGEPAEARALMEKLDGRIEAAEAAARERAAAAEARFAGIEAAAGPGGAAELAERLARLHEKKDAGLEAALARLGPIEARLGGVEGGVAPLREALKRLESRVEALAGEERAARTELAALKADAGGPVKALAEELARLHAQKEALAEQVLGRLAELETEMAARDAAGSPFAAISEQLTALYAQKDATVEAVFARLAPLEARLAEMEGRDDPQGALDRFAERLAALEAPGESPFAAISEQLTALYAQKDATVEAVFARLAPLEARLAEMEGRDDPQGALDRFAERLAALEAPGESPFAAISEQLTALYAQKDATVEAVFARLAPLEAKLAELQRGVEGLDPRAALDRFGERLEATRSTLAGEIEALKAEGPPFAAISEQLTALYAQKDATVEAVFTRLAPLEARLAKMEGREDPKTALDRFGERLEATRSTLAGEIEALKAEGTPFAAISEQLTALYAQKDATVEAVFTRLAPLEARLAEMEGRDDPQGALDRFAERLAALEEPGESPFAAISEQLTALYAQKDATVEAVFARLAPLEAKLAELQRGVEGLDPKTALDRFGERLEATRSTLAGEIEALKAEGPPFAAISEQLTALYAQKDATVEAVFTRLAPLEARLAKMEGRDDPQGALDRFAERLEATRSTLAGEIEALKAEGTPFAAISEQLTALYAQKDATVEAVFARLAPLEAKLAELEGGFARLGSLAEDDPRAAVEGLRARLEALHWTQGEVAAGLAALQARAAAEAGTDPAAPLAEVAAQLTRLYAQKDAVAASVVERLGPLEARLAALETRPGDAEAEMARAQARAIADELIVARAAAERTALFADRLAVLEASLPRLSAARLQAMRDAPPPSPRPVPETVPETAPETARETEIETARRTVPEEAAAAKAAAGTAAGEARQDAPQDPGQDAADEAELWNLPRIVSLHHK